MLKWYRCYNPIFPPGTQKRDPSLPSVPPRYFDSRRGTLPVEGATSLVKFKISTFHTREWLWIKFSFFFFVISKFPKKETDSFTHHTYKDNKYVFWVRIDIVLNMNIDIIVKCQLGILYYLLWSIDNSGRASHPLSLSILEIFSSFLFIIFYYFFSRSKFLFSTSFFQRLIGCNASEIIPGQPIRLTCWNLSWQS